MSVVYFLLLLGVLVVIHELGHFVAAKLLDFKVLRFSIGFGRPIVRVRGRETEYQIGVVPLGGYTRILGEEDGDAIESDDAARAFGAKPLWQRLVVVFAGPAANLIFPVLVYLVFFAGHSRLPAAVIGDVLPDSPAERAGLQPGDRIVAIGGDAIRYWEELEGSIEGSVGLELRLRVRRGDRELEKFITPVEALRRSRDGRSARGGAIGVTQVPFRPQVGVLDETSAAGRAGLRTGDVVISVDGTPVANWAELDAQLSGSARRRTVAYLRGTRVAGFPGVKLLEPGFADLIPEVRTDEAGRRATVTGLESAELFVATVEPGSPAAAAGLAPGDFLQSLDGEPIRHWLTLDQVLQARPEHAWTLAWMRPRAGAAPEAMTAQIVQERRRVRDEYGHETSRLTFGAANDFERGEPELVPIDNRVTYAVSKAVERTGDTVVEMASGFWAIVRGRAPHDAVGGPIMMYRVASVSGAKGWDAFLLMMALISVNLGLINLLPVPVLDGGHLLVFAIEAVRRRALSARARERIMLCGLAVVAAITVLALRNDVMRYVLQ